MAYGMYRSLQSFRESHTRLLIRKHERTNDHAVLDSLWHFSDANRRFLSDSTNKKRMAFALLTAVTAHLQARAILVPLMVLPLCTARYPILSDCRLHSLPRTPPCSRNLKAIAQSGFPSARSTLPWSIHLVATAALSLYKSTSRP
eukprot:TRINITY_DN57_c2_g1_i1.p1 TRINITY_DN57_c2_g1~~TRINITY_DN57_c2_g1_i1.p1  ORF type:complete len:145 (-),score=12.83 TRINITY_DN57_c2_g1_i1:553-987(-)